MTSAPVRHRAWLTSADCDLAEFRAVVEVETDPADYPHADRVERGVLSYGERLADDVATPEGRRALQAELAQALMDGPEGYPFPTNLDRDTPVGSLNPESQAQLVWRALQNDWDEATFVVELAAQTERRRSSLSR